MSDLLDEDEQLRSVTFRNARSIFRARKRAEQRLRTQDTVTRVLAEAGSLNEAASRILPAICEHLGWHVGALWYVDPQEDVLRCADVYHLPLQPAPRFEGASRRRVFERGIGLPGRVWADGRASWIRDVVEDGNFPRAPIARAEGLHGAFGFPITLNGQVLGVIEFFSREIRQPDEDLLAMMTAIGSQIGQFIERRRAEEALRESELRHRMMAERLKEIDRRKDEFLAMLAHELRNPLAPIRNAVQIFRSRRLPTAELRWAIDVIDRQVRQMTRLVDDLLDVSRITRGEIELRMEMVELADVVNSAIEASRPFIDKRGHRLNVTLPAEPVRLEADAARLAQVLLNLLNNAAKYTDPGGEIDVGARRQGGDVEIRVKDNGIGIPADVLPRVFDLFAQADRSTGRTDGGLGIGLTLVQRLVDLHGGSVEGRSEGPGRGSTFLVRLPIAKQPEGAARKQEGGEEAAAAATPHRILVVDDNRDAADSLAMLLRMLGNEVRIAHDGLEAVGATASFRPEVVLMDIGMPKLDGYEAARRIRAQDRGAELLLVAISGWGQEKDRERSLQAGFDHHLTKPVEFDVLRRLLAGRSSH